jgi:hypothetical protein
MKAEAVIDTLLSQLRIDTRAKIKQDEIPSKQDWFLVRVPG